MGDGKLEESKRVGSLAAAAGAALQLRDVTQRSLCGVLMIHQLRSQDYCRSKLGNHGRWLSNAPRKRGKLKNRNLSKL